MAKVFQKIRKIRNLLIYFGIFYFQHEIWGGWGSFCFCFCFLWPLLSQTNNYEDVFIGIQIARCISLFIYLVLGISLVSGILNKYHENRHIIKLIMFFANLVHPVQVKSNVLVKPPNIFFYYYKCSTNVYIKHLYKKQF